ncbi:Clavaminate synthase-like protein [Lactarius hengduanensis]|nr:Clavaminate synthase-like protein [Lactarius hengduanensis]
MPDASHATPLPFPTSQMMCRLSRSVPEMNTKSTVSGRLLLNWPDGADGEVDAIFEMGAHTMALPLEEKMRYKFAGAIATDASGALDSAEHSGSEASCINKTATSTPEPLDRAVIEAHTDFGSPRFRDMSPLTRANVITGWGVSKLQVLPPGTDEWKYVKPIPRHAICNIGDAMVIFSAGILHSNLHRVVPPPKAQASFDRWSLVFFTCPGNSVSLAPLTKESTLIAEAAARAPESRYATGSTAGEWFRRRVQNLRIKNQAGPETWRASRGTEHTEAY